MSRAKVKDGLTLQELRFVEAYMGAAEGNASRAAEIAGYSFKTREQLHDLARKLIKKPHIKAALEQRAAYESARDVAAFRAGVRR